MTTTTLERFIFCLLLWTSSVNAQQPYSLQLNNENGLPSNVIYNIHQDRQGFLWLATDQGLFKYDGFEYKRYKSLEQPSIAGSHINEDKYGRIWYENFDGFIYYIENDSIKGLNQNKPVGFITYQINEKYLYAIQENGIDIFDLKSLKLVKTLPLSFKEAEHTTVLEHDFYLIADNILYRIDSSFNLSSSAYFATKNLKVKYIYPYKKQLYIVSKFNEEKQLYFFNSNLQYQKSVSIPDIEYFQGSNVIDDIIWLHSSKGLVAYHEKENSTYLHVFFPTVSTSEIIKDYQNNYLISTVYNGVLIVPEFKDLVYSIPDYTSKKIIPYKNGYLLGTTKGDLINLDTKFKIENRLHTTPENLPVYYIYHDSIDNITIFSGNGFSLVTNGNFRAAKNYKIALKEAVRLDEKYYAFAASGFIGLLKNPKSNTNTQSVWDNLFNQNIDPDYSSVARIKSGFRAKSIDYNPSENKLVVATNTGIHIVSPAKTEEIKRNGTPLHSDRVCFLGNEIYVLDSKGNLYRITKGKNSERVNHALDITNPDVLKIKKINHELIIVTREYIYILDAKTKQINKLHVRIKGNQIQDVLKQNDHLIVLLEKEVFKFPLNIPRIKKHPLFQINHFTANETEQDWKRPIILKHNEHNISVEFSILEFGETKSTLSYRLNGDSWIGVANTIRKISFPSLSTGTYQLEFKINDTKSNQQILFEITNPFWQKWWFYLIGFILLSSLLYLYFRWQFRLMHNQIRLLNDKIILEKSLSKSMLSAIKSQMNPHFFYNALNTIQAYIFTNDKHKANTYLAKFSKLTRIILEMSEGETISLNEEIAALELYLELESMRFSENLSWEINLGNKIEKDTIEIPPMLIQPYVENAIKHGLLHKEGEKKVSILFEIKKDILIVSIDDNGIGRNRSAELNKIKQEKFQSFSSKANEKRLEILNKEMNNRAEIVLTIIDKFNEHGTSVGTKVTLAIPI